MDSLQSFLISVVFIRTMAISILLTAVSYFFGLSFGWITPENLSYLEVSAVFTSYVCTILCVHQTRWNYPIGVLTTFLYSWLFFKWEMYAVALFNLYLVFSLVYGWFRWGSDEYTIPVTSVKDKWWIGYAFLGLAIWGLLLAINQVFGVSITWVEILITVLSGVAQFLLDNKKIENWIVWIGVNVLSIWFFWHSGLYLVAFQYIFFLGNAFVGWYSWERSRVSRKTYEEFTDRLYN